VIPLALAVTLFMPAFFGNDQSNVMTRSEVNTTLTFFQAAKPGSLVTVIGNAPVSDTADYNEFPVATIFGYGGLLPGSQAISEAPSYLARTMKKLLRRPAGLYSDDPQHVQLQRGVRYHPAGQRHCVVGRAGEVPLLEAGRQQGRYADLPDVGRSASHTAGGLLEERDHVRAVATSRVGADRATGLRAARQTSRSRISWVI